MKIDHIKVGGTYSDNRMGIRRVLDMGAHLRTSGSDPQAIGVRYEVLAAVKEPDVGTQSTMELKSLAIWAKAEIASDQIEARIIEIQAEKVEGRLSVPQHVFLKSFEGMGVSLGDYIECPRSEFRMAKSCAQKGMVAEMPDALGKNEDTFQMAFSPLGVAVIKRIERV